MKRKSFQSISTVLLGVGTLISSLCTAPLTYAYHNVAESGVDADLLPTGTEINGKRYWSVSEMLKASELVDAKRQEFCANEGSMCESELSFEQAEYFGGIYRALESFSQSRFMLTSINPSLGKMKLLFRDEDKMMGHMFGEPVRYVIDSIYTVWVEESLGDPARDTRWLYTGYRYPYNLGANEEEAKAASHVIMDESSSELGSGWFTPNVEREYDIKDSQIENNTSGRVFFTYLTDNGGSSHGTLNYKGCINSPDYREGMECKMMYSDEGRYEMLPMEPVTDNTGKTAIDNDVEHPTDDTMPQSTENGTDARLISIIKTTPTSESVSYTPKAPDTSTATEPRQNEEQIAKSSDNIVELSSIVSNGEESSFTLPWWLTALMFFGSLFLIFSSWLLLPLLKQRSVKNLKKVRQN